jgi:hypothetical protein
VFEASPADAGTLVFRDRGGQVVGHVVVLLATAPSGNMATGHMASAALATPILQIAPAQARADGEAELQILEGLRYEYECNDAAWRLALRGNDSEGVVCPSRLASRKHSGTLVPGLATGLMQLVLEDAAGQPQGWAGVEVRSRKLDYKADYRRMMEDISARCVDLLGDWRAPSQFKVVPDAGNDALTVGQRFAFVRALLEGPGFRDALHRIISQPHQRWDHAPHHQALSRGFKPGRQAMTQLAQGARRVALPAQHPLRARLASVPERITVMRATETEDTPENRFVKFALRSFQHFLADVLQKVSPEKEPRLAAEVQALSTQLAMALDSDVLRHAGEPLALPLGSPVLQRREGYREVLQAWLQFALAAKLVWQGGEDVYGAGQRDVATLYEYWVFFYLLDVVGDLFALDKPPGQSLLEPTADGFGLKLKAGKFLALNGKARMHQRELQVQFSYNRSFVATSVHSAAGSWSQPMRPDYTVSLWPAEFSAAEAETQELMVHVHFDAKYRVENLKAVMGTDANSGPPASPEETDAALSEEKRQQSHGRYKRADLLKMHAYRDAIRRTQGAYVLYPGDVDLPLRGFHEVLPGLGAFALRPGGGTAAVAGFLAEVVAHVCNRASAREQQSFATYLNYRAEEPAALYQAYPERQGDAASAISHRARPLCWQAGARTLHTGPGSISMGCTTSGWTMPAARWACRPTWPAPTTCSCTGRMDWHTPVCCASRTRRPGPRCSRARPCWTAAIRATRRSRTIWCTRLKPLPSSLASSGTGRRWRASRLALRQDCRLRSACRRCCWHGDQVSAAEIGSRLRPWHQPCIQDQRTALACTLMRRPIPQRTRSDNDGP